MEQDARTIFLGVMGAPYESEMTTSLFRILDAALEAGHAVAVWTCGGATTLTTQSVGDAKPRNIADMGTALENMAYPSTAALVRSLLAAYEGRLKWYVCRHCMEERGAQEQIQEVKIEAPFRFVHHLQKAESSMIMGVK